MVWAMNHQDQTTVKGLFRGSFKPSLSILVRTTVLEELQCNYMYGWVSTGKILACLRRHYQNFNGVCFTSDSANFVSIGEEGLVN
jgi:hypothetical protein